MNLLAAQNWKNIERIQNFIEIAVALFFRFGGTTFFFCPLWVFFILLLICAYKAWVISPPCPHPLRPLPLPPTPSIPSRNYFALISNFVEERV
jgi:hypothetical protein